MKQHWWETQSVLQTLGNFQQSLSSFLALEWALKNPNARDTSKDFPATDMAHLKEVSTAGPCLPMDYCFGHIITIPLEKSAIQALILLMETSNILAKQGTVANQRKGLVEGSLWSFLEAQLYIARKEMYSKARDSALRSLQGSLVVLLHRSCVSCWRNPSVVKAFPAQPLLQAGVLTSQAFWNTATWEGGLQVCPLRAELLVLGLHVILTIFTVILRGRRQKGLLVKTNRWLKLKAFPETTNKVFS